MLPPVMEIFIVWHPDDAQGEQVADTIIEHFRSPSFSGVIGGGVQVSVRSVPWDMERASPRPCYSRNELAPNKIEPARFIAIVPLMGLELAKAVEDGSSDWFDYLSKLVEECVRNFSEFRIFPYTLNDVQINGTKLQKLLGKFQVLGATDISKTGETQDSVLCRDLSQGLAQFLADKEDNRLTVFVSHTKRNSPIEGERVEELIELVRSVISVTRLAEYFDASDLQPGVDWDEELRRKAANSALLSIRTDLYSSREWCQREVVVAKLSGMPIVTLDAIDAGEERGSFLMDHVPRLPVRHVGGEWKKTDVVSALNLLTDECLKRAIWKHQQSLAEAEGDYDIAWWAPHAPELLTLLYWIEANAERLMAAKGVGDLRILHPDPPLGPEERDALVKQAKVSALGRSVDIMTPRLLASRGG